MENSDVGDLDPSAVAVVAAAHTVQPATTKQSFPDRFQAWMEPRERRR
jgi:hypothetical protein